jgi:hypothetical protein
MYTYHNFKSLIYKCIWPIKLLAKEKFPVVIMSKVKTYLYQVQFLFIYC